MSFVTFHFISFLYLCEKGNKIRNKTRIVCRGKFVANKFLNYFWFEIREFMFLLRLNFFGYLLCVYTPNVHRVTFGTYVESFTLCYKNLSRGYRPCISTFFFKKPNSSVCNIVYLRTDKYREWNECLIRESF